MKLYKQPTSGAVMTHENTVPVYVIDDLSLLDGPAGGTTSLPVRLDWTPANTYDIARPTRLRTMYATVLREARSEADLALFLNRELLLREWRMLRLPEFVRTSWEQAHPELLSC